MADRTTQGATTLACRATGGGYVKSGMTKRAGFTLVELLVTIGIIAVLIGILLPVVSKLKRAAYSASSAQSISTLQAAIQQYWSTFQAYPGPRPSTGYGAPFTPSAEPTNASSSEDLVLALKGGLKIDTTTTPYTLSFAPTDVGRGTISLNLRNPKRYQEFGGVPTGNFNTNDIPEFQDAFPDPMPIHYLRAKSAGSTVPFPDFATLNTPYYLAPNNLSIGTADGSDADTAPDFADRDAYLKDPSSTTTPPVSRNADSYVLISAGPDRKLGTKDDITNFGTPGE